MRPAPGCSCAWMSLQQSQGRVLLDLPSLAGCAVRAASFVVHETRATGGALQTTSRNCKCPRYTCLALGLAYSDAVGSPTTERQRRHRDQPWRGCTNPGEHCGQTVEALLPVADPGLHSRHARCRGAAVNWPGGHSRHTVRPERRQSTTKPAQKSRT